MCKLCCRGQKKPIVPSAIWALGIKNVRALIFFFFRAKFAFLIYIIHQGLKSASIFKGHCGPLFLNHCGPKVLRAIGPSALPPYADPSSSEQQHKNFKGFTSCNCLCSLSFSCNTWLWLTLNFSADSTSLLRSCRNLSFSVRTLAMPFCVLSYRMLSWPPIWCFSVSSSACVCNDINFYSSLH